MDSEGFNGFSDSSYLTLSDLPYEILEEILSYENLSHVDICHTSEVCRKLHHVANSSRLWRIKFYQAWRSLSKLYDGHDVDWKEGYQQRCMFGFHVRKMVATMCEELVFSHVLDTLFMEFKESSEKYKFASEFMIDELESMLYDGKCYSHLTTKYYCSKLLHFARQYHLKKVFQDFLSKCDTCCQPLEIGACIISQFCQPVQRIMVQDISENLDNIALSVKHNLSVACPKHPVLFSDIIPSSTVLSESLWSPSECRTILTCISDTLFDGFDFKCIYEGEGFSTDQILIDKVLIFRTGVPVVIAIIYAAVAHRLGVICELCEPGSAALKWLEHPLLDHVNRYTFIEMTKCGKFSTPAEFSASVDARAYDATEFHTELPLQVFTYIIKNLSYFGGRDLQHLEERLLYEASVLELNLVVYPSDKEKILMLVQLYLQMDIRLCEARDLLQQLTPSDPYFDYRVKRMRAELESRMIFFNHQEGKELQSAKKKLREDCPAVSFAVGMIMKHKKYDYVCVIYGWDSVCRATDDWIHQMRVHELKNKSNQPFYNVLVEDCTLRYAAQENLEICTSPWFIKHPEVGKYFDEFRHNHFVPNVVVSAEYPQDASVRESMLKEFYRM